MTTDTTTPPWNADTTPIQDALNDINDTLDSLDDRLERVRQSYARRKDRVGMHALDEANPRDHGELEELIEAMYEPSDRRFPDDSCWVWMGFVDGQGSPVVEDRNLNWYYAARIAWYTKQNMAPIIPSNMALEATCGESHCINPTHLKMRRAFYGEQSWPAQWAQRTYYDRQSKRLDGQEMKNDEWTAMTNDYDEYKEWRNQRTWGQPQPNLLALPAPGQTSTPLARTGTSTAKPTTTPGKHVANGKPTNGGPTGKTAQTTPSNGPFTYGVTNQSAPGGTAYTGGSLGTNPHLVGAAAWGSLSVRGDLRSLNPSAPSPNVAVGKRTAPRTGQSTPAASTTDDGANGRDYTDYGDYNRKHDQWRGSYGTARFGPKNITITESFNGGGAAFTQRDNSDRYTALADHFDELRHVRRNKDIWGFVYRPENPAYLLNVGERVYLYGDPYIMLPDNWLQRADKLTATDRKAIHDYHANELRDKLHAENVEKARRLYAQGHQGTNDAKRTIKPPPARTDATDEPTFRHVKFKDGSGGLVVDLRQNRTVYIAKRTDTWWEDQIGSDDQPTGEQRPVEVPTYFAFERVMGALQTPTAWRSIGCESFDLAIKVAEMRLRRPRVLRKEATLEEGRKTIGQLHRWVKEVGPDQLHQAMAEAHVKAQGETQ